MVRSGSGEWVYVFHPDADGKAEQPMTLLPSAALERMEEVQSRRAVRPEFILTGQVFVYNRTNYLLPTAFAVAPPPALPTPTLAPDPETPPAERDGDQEQPPGAPPAEAGAESEPAPPAPQPATPPAAPPPPGAALDAAVSALIQQIESERPGARALAESSLLADITRADPEAEADSKAVRPRPDGELLVRRRGRLVRRAGEWRLTLDNDPGGPSDLQTTMVVLPCLNLERMEALAADRGENLSFEVSGMVQQYRRRNFILPTIYRITREGDVHPLQ
jgi:hypothetical protein